MSEKEKMILGMKAFAFDEIKDMIANPWEYCLGNTEEEKNSRTALIGAVYGILEYVEDAIKEMEKGEDV